MTSNFGFLRCLWSSILLLLLLTVNKVPVCYSQPTPTPGPAPSNDRCVNAIEIFPDIPIEGSNANANFDYYNQAVCGARSDRRGVWYVVTGTGNPYTAHLCSLNISENNEEDNNSIEEEEDVTTEVGKKNLVIDFDEQQIINFGVFYTCNSQNCHGYPDEQLSNELFDCDKDESQSYSWFSEVGSRYYLHIRGPELGSNFSLIVADTGGQTPANNLCTDAERLTLPAVVKATTTGSNHDFYSPNFCGQLSNHAGIWYKIVGDGNVHKVSLCTTNDVPMDFGLFNECGTRSCIGSSDYKLAKCDDNDAIEYTYQSTINTTYYIHIRSETGDSNFALRVVNDNDGDDGPHVPGDTCDDPIPIGIGETIIGTTTNSTYDFVNEFQCGSKSDLPGIWVSLVGDGRIFAVSICQRLTNNDNDNNNNNKNQNDKDGGNSGVELYASIYNGCDGGDCIGVSDGPIDICNDSNNEEEEEGDFLVHSNVDQVYLIHIRSDHAAEFELSIERCFFTTTTVCFKSSASSFRQLVSTTLSLLLLLSALPSFLLLLL